MDAIVFEVKDCAKKKKNHSGLRLDKAAIFPPPRRMCNSGVSNAINISQNTSSQTLSGRDVKAAQRTIEQSTKEVTFS